MNNTMFLIPTWFADFLSGHGLCRMLMETGIAIWNAMMKFVFVLMGQDVGDFAGGQLVNLMKKVNTVFVGVGTALVVLFFFWGLFNDSTNIKEEMTADKWFKILFRLLFSNFFVIHSLEILQGFLGIAVKLNNKLLSVNKTDMQINFDQFGYPELGVSTAVDIILLNWIWLTVLGFVFMLVMAVCALTIVYTVYIRVIKICIYMPFGAISFSTMSSQSPEFHSMAMGYFKYFLSLAFEICVISLAILMCNAVMSAGFTDITNAIVKSITGLGDNFLLYYKTTLGNAIGCMLMASLTVGTVKSANMISSKIFS